jgi:hypothetical protein
MTSTENWKVIGSLFALVKFIVVVVVGVVVFDIIR